MKLTTLPDRVFEIGEDAIYIIIGMLLFVASVFLVVHVVEAFFYLPEERNFVRWIVEILDKILLMLMIIEVVYTVRISYKEHSLRPRPFLIVALIAAIRRIMVLSVETAYIPEKFEHYMIEMGLLGVLVFIFVVSIIMLDRQKIKSAGER